MSDDIEFVPEPIQEELSYRQAYELDSHYQQYRAWLENCGKDPDRKIGFAQASVPIQFHRTNKFHEWVWNQVGHWTTRFTHAHANHYEQALSDDTIRTKDGEPYAEGSKRKRQEAVLNYFNFREDVMGEAPWTPNLSFSQSAHDSSDYLTLDERQRLYEAALTYDDLGKYNDLSPETRDRQKRHLAQKLGKPKSEIKPADFRDARTSWKIPSLITVSLDLGARPALIERCRHEWYKPEKGVFQIPKEKSAKNDAYWESNLSTRSIRVLNRWVSQRSALPKYDDTENLWLNREGNPYNSQSLNHLLDDLLLEAGIDQDNRKLTFTSIRRSTATYLTYFESLAYASEQLRQKTLEATRRYVEIPVEASQDVLDQLEGGFSTKPSSTTNPATVESSNKSKPASRMEATDSLSEVLHEN